MTYNTTRGCCFTRNKNNEPLVFSKHSCQKMSVYDYLKLTPNPTRDYDIFEVQFKNTHKYFFKNGTKMKFNKGDIVVVESNPGYNIGVITMCSDLVSKQMFNRGFNPEGFEFQKITRLPTTIDLKKWEESISLENSTMISARQISSNLGLEMKIGDVEYQADRMKAIFYYIAESRVDFRELIKILAEQFRIRVEMKQIGARQEAGHIGGIGCCGRELCCSTWQSKFNSVSINAARVQDLTPSPQKMAGQCGKLKCCMNYELDSYLDARESMPRINAPIDTLHASYHLVKTDVLRGIMYFSSDPHNPALSIPLSKDKVRQILSMIRKGQKIEDLKSLSLGYSDVPKNEPSFENVVGQDSLTRFDKNDKLKNGSNSFRGGGRRNSMSNNNENHNNRAYNNRDNNNNRGDSRREPNRDNNRDNNNNRGDSRREPNRDNNRDNNNNRGDSRREPNRDNNRDNNNNRGDSRRAPNRDNNKDNRLK